MATDVSDAFINQYESEVHQQFQRRASYLLPTVRTKGGVKGQAIVWQKMGTGTATTKSRHGTITPMNVSHTPITNTLADFYAGDWADNLDLFKLNIDERFELGQAGAGALGRQIDSQITTALDATTQTAVTITVTSFAAIRAGLVNAVEDLADNDTPMDGNVWGVLTNRGWSQALQVAQFASSDYTGPENLAFMEGFKTQKEFKSWMGVHWQAHNGLPGKGTATAKGFVYHKTACGYGYAKLVEGMDGPSAKVDITWHGDRQAWFIAHCMSGQAALIDDLGVIETNHDDTTGIATS